MTDQEMIDKFLQEGGKIKKIELNMDNEYSKYGGKTKSHLTYAQSSGMANFEVKHPFEGRKFILDGVETSCIRVSSKRSKTGVLHLYFIFSNGVRLFESSLTRKRNNGKAELINE
jgi:hypothetical protein